MLQQLSGINAVMFYSSKIFEKMSLDAKLGSGLVGFINMASTFGALFLLGSKYLRNKSEFNEVFKERVSYSLLSIN
jgi:hypothetical protein